MATRNRNRNRTQRRNKNRSRRNRQGGGAPPISCNNARGILNDPQAGMVKKMAAKVQLKSCANGMKTVAPNQRWSMATRSRRNRRQGGGAPPISCNNAKSILNDPQAGMVKKMAAKVQLKSCANGMKTVAPTKKWFNSTTKNSEYGYCDSGYSSKGSTTCKDGTSPVKPPGLTV